MEHGTILFVNFVGSDLEEENGLLVDEFENYAMLPINRKGVVISKFAVKFMSF
ncbi:MAG: hypothetical protein ABIE14_04270 [Patescibacteria group bacterium]